MKSTNFAIKLLSRLAAAALLIAVIAGPAARAGSLVGQPAPAFTLTNAVTGSGISLSSLNAGKQATVIIFISTQCPVSRAYNARYNALANAFAGKGVDVVGINSNETEPIAEVADNAKQNKFTFPVLKDPGSAVADAYSANHTPEVFVVDSHGTVVYHGRIDNNMDPDQVTSHDLVTALDQILAGKTVSPSETKAFGCSIKRHQQ